MEQSEVKETENKETETKLYSVKSGTAKLLSFDKDSLKEFNEANKVEHVVFFFSYLKDDKKENNLLTNIMMKGVNNNRYSVILDLTNFNDEDKKALTDGCSNNTEINATTIIANVAQLCSCPIINNGIREYTTLNASYVGILSESEKQDAFVSLKNRVARQLNDGILFKGALTPENNEKSSATQKPNAAL